MKEALTKQESHLNSMNFSPEVKTRVLSAWARHKARVLASIDKVEKRRSETPTMAETKRPEPVKYHIPENMPSKTPKKPMGPIYSIPENDPRFKEYLKNKQKAM